MFANRCFSGARPAPALPFLRFPVDPATARRGPRQRGMWTDERFMTSTTKLSELRQFARMAEAEADMSLARLARPRHIMPTRKSARLLNPIDSSPPQVAEPSLHLLCDTASAFMRSIPETPSSRSLFLASVSRLDLPLQASTGRGIPGRVAPRIGDTLQQSKSLAELESTLTTSSIPSKKAIFEFNRTQAKRSGRALLLEGGAGLHPESAWALRLLQVSRSDAQLSRAGE